MSRLLPMPPRLQGALLAAAVVALTGFSPGRGTTARPGSADPTGGGRRPQAIAVASLANAGEVVVVGHRVGTVSVLRAADRVLLGEAAVGGNITSLVPLPGKPDAPARLVAVDRDRDQLLILRLTLPAESPLVPFPAARTRPVVEVEGTFPTCRDPMRAVVRGGGVACSCLGPREARRYDLIVRADGRAALAPGWTTSLPFEARELLRLDDRHLLVADAFGGGLAVLDLGSGAILRSLELTAHNLRGLALVSGGDRVAIVHQELHSGMHTSSDDIRWGVFLTNSVRLLSFTNLTRATGWRSEPTTPGRGARCASGGGPRRSPSGAAGSSSSPTPGPIRSRWSRSRTAPRPPACPSDLRRG